MKGLISGSFRYQESDQWCHQLAHLLTVFGCRCVPWRFGKKSPINLVWKRERKMSITKCPHKSNTGTRYLFPLINNTLTYFQQMGSPISLGRTHYISWDLRYFLLVFCLVRMCIFSLNNITLSKMWEKPTSVLSTIHLSCQRIQLWQWLCSRMI